jgi:hypothetical protein
MFELFPRLCLEDSSFIEICYELRVVYINAFSRLWQYRAEFLLEWEIFHTKGVEKLKTHFVFYNFFPESRAVYEIISKNVMEPETPQITMIYGAGALHAG